MKVINLAITPCAGSPIDLSSAINDYLDGWESELYQEKVAYNDGRVFEGDIKPLDRENVWGQIKDADAFILHNNGPCPPWGMGFQEQLLPDDNRPKIWVIHSPYYWWDATSWGRMKNVSLVTWCGLHSILWKRSMAIPINAMPQIIRWEKYLAKDRDREGLPVIVFAPSTKRWQDPFHTKGFPIVDRHLKQLEVDGKIDYHLVHGRSHLECLEAISKADICIDDIITGEYHRVFLESCASGVMAVTGMTSEVKSTMARCIGCQMDEIPGIRLNPRSFINCFESIVKDREMTRKYGQQGRRFIEEHWHPAKIIERFVRPLLERSGKVCQARVP